jgi:hypothetical protein
MSTEMEFFWVYAGREVLARAEIEPPDESVGIMGVAAMNVRLFDIGGDEILLTNKMIDEILEDPGFTAVVEDHYYSDKEDLPVKDQSSTPWREVTVPMIEAACESLLESTGQDIGGDEMRAALERVFAVSEKKPSMDESSTFQSATTPSVTIAPSHCTPSFAYECTTGGVSCSACGAHKSWEPGEDPVRLICKRTGQPAVGVRPLKDYVK